MATLIAASGALLAAGALARHPAGFVTIAIGYGLIESAVVASDAKLQDSISGPARATVTSVSGLSSEIVAVAIFGVVAVGSSWLSVSALLAVVTVPTLAVAAAVRRWWPSPVDLRAPATARAVQRRSWWRKVSTVTSRAERDVVRSPDDVALSRVAAGQVEFVAAAATSRVARVATAIRFQALIAVAVHNSIVRATSRWRSTYAALAPSDCEPQPGRGPARLSRWLSSASDPPPTPSDCRQPSRRWRYCPSGACSSPA